MRNSENTIAFQKFDRKRLSSIVLAFLIAAAVFPLAYLQPAYAADVETHAFLNVSPNPTGINQPVNIIMWLIEVNPTVSGAQGSRFTDYTVVVTEPDGTKQPLGPFTADAASYAYTDFVPVQNGTYTLNFTFPGQHITGFDLFGLPVDSYYAASSFTMELTVQQQPVSGSPQTHLPSEYWTRPVNAQNQAWYAISGNWLGLGAWPGWCRGYNGTGNYNPYTSAPGSAHILWTEPLTFGGLIGGEFGDTTTSNYYTGKDYEKMFTPPVIINGVLYYNVPAPPRNGFYAVDLRTGETLWKKDGIDEAGYVGMSMGSYGYGGITMGQVYNYKSPNQIGGIPYLWSFTPYQNFHMYDAVTGDYILTIANATKGYTVEGPNGELLMYYLSNDWLAMWNSSLRIGTSDLGFPFEGTALWNWRPQVNATIDWQRGVQWNVTTEMHPGQAISSINSGVILATTASIFFAQDWQTNIAYDQNTGQQLWVQNRTFTSPTSGFMYQTGRISQGMFTEYDAAEMVWYGFDAYSGNKLWGPTEALDEPWGTIYQNVFSVTANGVFYGHNVDGIHAINATTGERMWDFYGHSSGLDFPGFNTYPFATDTSLTLADGKLYASTGNSHSDPLFRGALLYCIDADSGKEIWSINGFYIGTMPIADGILVAQNGYDNQLYAFSKGQTATTVLASPKVSVHGNSVLVEGMVTDQSPGNTCLGIPVAGTPAIADESMSAWMEYLYMQQEKPTNATGVEVTIEVLDPNNNYYEVGRTTSDDSGMFKMTFTPEVPGEYAIIATFQGSESYYSSYAQTAINVEEAPAATPEPTPEPASLADIYILPGIVGIIIAVVVVGLVLILMLRKR